MNKKVGATSSKQSINTIEANEKNSESEKSGNSKGNTANKVETESMGKEMSESNSQQLKWVLECNSLTKEYQIGPQTLKVLDALELKVEPGEVLAVIGSSGSGKSTLLNMLGGLDLASSGEVKLAGKSFSQLSEGQANTLRNQSLGFVYQFHHLLPEFSAIDNVAMPLLISGMAKKEARKRSEEMLERVGLKTRGQHKPSELSGGERQRVAIARALVHKPDIVLMDEPTGNLDRDTAEAIQKLIFELNDVQGSSFLIVTHDPSFAQLAGRRLKLEDGKLHSVA